MSLAGRTRAFAAQEAAIARTRLKSVRLSLPRRVECSVCGWRGARFLSDGWHEGCTCPWCLSDVRHRLLASALKELPDYSLDNLVRGKDVLHFAPEWCAQALLSRGSARYITADFAREDVDIRLDMSRMPELAARSYDTVVACDVLEHVPDNRAALRELNRILRADGTAILTVPQKDHAEVTFEDSSIRSDCGREEAFGQADHLRIYGADFVQRVAEAGFDVEMVEEESFGIAYARKHVLAPPKLLTRPLATNYRKVFFAKKR